MGPQLAPSLPLDSAQAVVYSDGDVTTTSSADLNALLERVRLLTEQEARFGELSAEWRQERREAMRELRARGLSLRMIGEAAGISKQQVGRLLGERS